MLHEPLYRRLREKARRCVLRSDSQLNPLNETREEPDLAPPGADWTAVPGLTGLQWRRSDATFTESEGTTGGPLYYDIAVPLPGEPGA
jgi:hypothetical protein